MKDFLIKECRLEHGRPVLVGVSGGPDSLCLLDLLHRSGYPVWVAHFNHSLRLEAAQEAEQVKRLSESMGLPFVGGKADVMAYSRAEGLSVEEAGRALRYRFLFEQANEVGAQAVAVGHQADDQVETVLMHLLRGSGLAGLRGMQPNLLPNPWSREIALVRPLLNTWRDEILDYCRERGLQPTLDRSNLDTTYYRNRLRHEIIPHLEEANPHLKKRIVQMANTLREDYAILEQVVETAWQACVIQKGPGYVAFSMPLLLREPLGVLRYLVRRGIALQRPGLRNIDFPAIERAVQFIYHPPDTSFQDLVAGLFLSLEGDRLYLAAWEADLPLLDWPQVEGELRQELPLREGSRLEISEGWGLCLEPVEDIQAARCQALENLDPYQAWVDADSLVDPLVVRTRRPGDRIQPLGMEGHSDKLADFMVNRKLPRRARPRWPLVCAGEQIVWIPGYGLGHPFCLTQATQHALHLRLEKKQVLQDM